MHKDIAKVDQGQPIIQKEIPFVKGHDENLEVLKAEVHEIEWEIVLHGVMMTLEQPGRSQ